MENNYISYPRVVKEVKGIKGAEGFVYSARQVIPQEKLEKFYQKILLPIHREVVARIKKDLGDEV